VNRGDFCAVKLDGLEFWVAGDLGGDFSDGEMNWAVVQFERRPRRSSVTPSTRSSDGSTR